MATHDLALYAFPTCPFCKRVFRYMEEAGIDIPIYDIHADPDAYDTLKHVGGKTQVPCLFIDGAPMYESLDIIAWLKANVAGDAGSNYDAEADEDLLDGAACMIPRK